MQMCSRSLCNVPSKSEEIFNGMWPYGGHAVPTPHANLTVGFIQVVVLQITEIILSSLRVGFEMHIVVSILESRNRLQFAATLQSCTKFDFKERNTAPIFVICGATSNSGLITCQCYITYLDANIPTALLQKHIIIELTSETDECNTKLLMSGNKLKEPRGQ